MHVHQQNLFGSCDSITCILHNIPPDIAPVQIQSENVNLLFGSHTER
jgi:hypothetical protein